MSAKITVTDRGLTGRLHALRGLGAYEVVVGVLADGKGGAAAKGSDDLVVLDLATIHEFGAPPHVPQRSFVRAWVDEHRETVRGWQREIARLVFGGKISAKQALDQLGAKVAGGMQQRIADGIAPPNAASTVERKGSATPLVDTGQLRSSITWAVRPRGGA